MYIQKITTIGSAVDRDFFDYADTVSLLLSEEHVNEVSDIRGKQDGAFRAGDLMIGGGEHQHQCAGADDRNRINNRQEVYRDGRPALLTTRAKLPAEGFIEDNRANEFSIRADKRQGLFRLYAKSALSIPHVAGTSDYYDLTQARWNEPETNTFNYEGSWL